MEERKKRIIIIVVAVLALLVYFKDDIKEMLNPEVTEELQTPAVLEIKSEVDIIYVQVSGEVIYPDIYAVPSNMLLHELLKLAGLKNTSDTSDLNLAQVVIPYNHYKVKEIDKENQNQNTNEAPIPIPEDDKININSASVEELMLLSGIGEVLALRIIEYREANPFTVIEEIMNVSGIKEAIFNKIKDSITV